MAPEHFGIARGPAAHLAREDSPQWTFTVDHGTDDSNDDADALLPEQHSHQVVTGYVSIAGQTHPQRNQYGRLRVTRR